MCRLGKHIHRLYHLGAQAATVQDIEVPGQGLGVAGDVDEHSWMQCRRRLQNRLVTAAAGRIENHHASRFGFGNVAAQQLKGIPSLEVAVVDVVEAGVFPGILHRRFEDFDARDPARIFGEMERDSSDATVDIQRMFVISQAGPLPDQGINGGSLTVVDLKERGGGNAQADFPYTGDEIGKTEDLMGFPAENDVSGRGIDILVNGYHLRNLALEPLGQRIQLPVVAFGSDESDHDLGAFRGNLDGEITEQSPACPGIVNKNILALNLFADHAGNLVEERVVKRAVADVHYLVGAPAVKAELNAPPVLGKNQLGGGAVSEGFGSGCDGIDLQVFQVCIRRKSVAQFFLLEIQLFGIIELQQRASLAIPGVPAGWRNTSGMSHQNFLQAGDDAVLALVFPCRQDFFTGKGASHPDFFVVTGADADPFFVEGLDVDFKGFDSSGAV